MAFSAHGCHRFSSCVTAFGGPPARAAIFSPTFSNMSDDSEVIAATMAKPGVVLQRPRWLE
jgi:hypothetical protein